jgi:hypothetical protein
VRIRPLTVVLIVFAGVVHFTKMGAPVPSYFLGTLRTRAPSPQARRRDNRPQCRGGVRRLVHNWTGTDLIYPGPVSWRPSEFDGVLTYRQFSDEHTETVPSVRSRIKADIKGHTWGSRQ